MMHSAYMFIHRQITPLIQSKLTCITQEACVRLDVRHGTLAATYLTPPPDGSTRKKKQQQGEGWGGQQDTFSQQQHIIFTSSQQQPEQVLVPSFTLEDIKHAVTMAVARVITANLITSWQRTLRFEMCSPQ
jgi:hypothetical protein